MATVLVTDGSDSFYESRTLFQTLWDHGSDIEKIVAFGPSTSDAKKMLLSRQARYSGLIEKLEFAEGGEAELSAAFGGGVTTWVVLNANAATLPTQLSAAASAGVSRVLVHLSAADAISEGEIAALKTAVEVAAASGAKTACTLMRTGSLGKGGSGGGLLVGELDEPVCEELPIDDTYRFMVESLTLPSADGRSFSLCPSVDGSQLKQMRMAGCTRREECDALLKGEIKPKTAAEMEAEAAAAADGKGGEGSGGGAAEEDDGRSEEEKAAAREEELKELLARAKERGIETQKRMAEEEAIKKQKREERLQYFKDNAPPEEEEEKGKGGGESDGSEEEEDKGEGDGKGDGKGGGGGDGKKDDDDDDGLAMV